MTVAPASDAALDRARAGPVARPARRPSRHDTRATARASGRHPPRPRHRRVRPRGRRPLVRRVRATSRARWPRSAGWPGSQLWEKAVATAAGRIAGEANAGSTSTPPKSPASPRAGSSALALDDEDIRAIGARLGSGGGPVRRRTGRAGAGGTRGRDPRQRRRRGSRGRDAGVAGGARLGGSAARVGMAGAGAGGGSRAGSLGGGDRRRCAPGIARRGRSGSSPRSWSPQRRTWASCWADTCRCRRRSEVWRRSGGRGCERDRRRGRPGGSRTGGPAAGAQGRARDAAVLHRRGARLSGHPPRPDRAMRRPGSRRRRRCTRRCNRSPVPAPSAGGRSRSPATRTGGRRSSSTGSRLGWPTEHGGLLVQVSLTHSATSAGAVAVVGTT